LAGIGLASSRLSGKTLTVAGAAQAGGRISASCFPFNFPCARHLEKDSRLCAESTKALEL